MDEMCKKKKKTTLADLRNSAAHFRSSRATRVQLISTVRVNVVKDFNYVLPLKEIHRSPDKGLVEVMEPRDNVEK